jgi:hypothetical protein
MDWAKIGVVRHLTSVEAAAEELITWPTRKKRDKAAILIVMPMPAKRTWRKPPTGSNGLFLEDHGTRPQAVRSESVRSSRVKVAMTKKQRPEALAQFAETARSDKKKDRPGLVADEATSPIPTDSKAKDKAATKVLQEGATGEDHGAEEAVDKLPDRILESRKKGEA